MTDNPNTMALAGPWEAVLTIGDGWVVTLDDVHRDHLDPGKLAIVIVRGSAAPFEVGAERRLPFSDTPGDVAAEWYSFDGYVDVANHWARAEAMTAGLNAAVAR